MSNSNIFPLQVPAYIWHKIQHTFSLFNPVKAVILLALLLITISVNAQEQTIKYNVLHNGKLIGHMNLFQKQTGDDVYLKMVSEVKLRFIMSINVAINEESVFQNGKLISSNINRNVNGKEKANRQTKAISTGYQTITEGKTGHIDQKQINSNLMLLYCREPGDNSRIYSDNFQQFLQVKQVSPHIYRIDLPDGNYNFYNYVNGICNSVDIHQSLYTIQIKRTPGIAPVSTTYLADKP